MASTNTQAPLERETLTFPESTALQFTHYLPRTRSTNTSSSSDRPFVTLTYATSLDASIALSPGAQTHLSGPASKAMTHHLRSKHDAILIGVGTAVADDPSLNCRIGMPEMAGERFQGQPRPVIVDPSGRWDVSKESKVVRLAREGKGMAPWIVCRAGGVVDSNRRHVLESVGGRYVEVASNGSRLGWRAILEKLYEESIRSIMVEGGGAVINDLLSPGCSGLVDSVIVTIAPVWLGTGGVVACPDSVRDGQGKKISVGRLKEVTWIPLEEDVVLCGRLGSAI